MPMRGWCSGISAGTFPARPTVVVQSMPGAGSLRSVMALNTSGTDGTTMVHFSSGLLTEAITAPDRVKVDFRSYAFIGNVSEDVRVCYLRSAIGVRNWAEMVAHRGGVIFAGSAAGTAGNANIAMLRNLFGVPLKIVQGYAGSAAKRLAIERGEVDGDCGGWTSVPEDWLRDKKINVIVRLSSTLLAGMDARCRSAAISSGLLTSAGSTISWSRRSGSDGCSWSPATCRQSAWRRCARLRCDGRRSRFPRRGREGQAHRRADDRRRR